MIGLAVIAVAIILKEGTASTLLPVIVTLIGSLAAADKVLEYKQNADKNPSTDSLSSQI
jgi:hypothetical protein